MVATPSHVLPLWDGRPLDANITISDGVQYRLVVFAVSTGAIRYTTDATESCHVHDFSCHLLLLVRRLVAATDLITKPAASNAGVPPLRSSEVVVLVRKQYELRHFSRE